MNRAKALLAHLAIFGATSSAFSATVIHITGSTAYRGQTNAAILKSFDNGATVQVGCTNASFSSSAVSYFHGMMNNVDTIVETKFTGSVGGIYAVTKGNALDFLPDNLDQTPGKTLPVTASASPTIPDFANNVNALPAGLNTVPAEVTMSDTYQDATIYRTPKLQGAVVPNGTELVGVVPFVWIRTPSADASIAAVNNMTPQLTNLLFGNGTLPLALWSGLAADETSLIYGAGRDPDSGTRLTTFAESGLGANAGVVQYRPAAGGETSTAVGGISQSGSITQVVVFPTTTVANLDQTFYNGNAGEATGGTLAAYMSKAFATGTPGALVAYSGTGDASGAIQKGAVILPWNGVSLATQPALGTAPTFDFNLIRNGRYTFWGYEHMLYLPGLLPEQQAVANKIATQIFNVDAQITLGSMRVRRAADGSQVKPVY